MYLPFAKVFCKGRSFAASAQSTRTPLFVASTLATLTITALLMLSFGFSMVTPTQAAPNTLSEETFTLSTQIEQTNGRCTTHKDPVKLSWFYKPPSDMTKMLKNYDFVVLTRGDEKYMQQAKSAGKYPVLQYIRFDSIHDPCGQIYKPKGTPCSCSSKPFRNNVGWSSEDICDIRDNHQDWFLRDANGKIVVIDKMVIMDPGNSGWRNFWLSRLKQSQADGWQGIFMDNMGTKFFSHGYGDKALQKYPTIESYQNAVLNFLTKVRSEYFAPNNRKMYGNITVHWGHTPYYLKMMEQMDGSMDEFWAATKSGYYSVKSWEDRLLRAKESLKQGNVVMLTSQGTQSDLNRQRFTFASYLLVASPNTYFRYTNQDYAYGQFWLYDNYKAKLGEPLGDYTRSGNVWSRKFANGKVTVDPEKRTSSITLYNTDGGC
jgi:hypothetical protein